MSTPCRALIPRAHRKASEIKRKETPRRDRGVAAEQSHLPGAKRSESRKGFHGPSVDSQARPMWRRVHWCLPTRAKPVCLSNLYSSWISGPHAIAGSSRGLAWSNGRSRDWVRSGVFFSRFWAFLVVAGDCLFFCRSYIVPALCAHVHHRHKNTIDCIQATKQIAARV